MHYIELTQQHKTSTERGEFHYSFDGDLRSTKEAVLSWLKSNGYRVEDEFGIKESCVVHAEHEDGMLWVLTISKDLPRGVVVVPFERVGGELWSGL